MICEGASLPLAGALVILPALAATGLVGAAAGLYATGRAAFYGLRSLLLATVFACLLGEPRAEGLTRVDPTDVGRLLGLDRAPEVKTMRRRMEALAALGHADQLIDALARRHLDAHSEATGIFYVDGHVRAYHGAREVPKAHVARIRLAMGAEVDTWVCDRNGDGLLVWSAPPGASLVGELRTVVTKIRELVGPDARPTIAFDRGGWSPTLFAELALAGFDILTYRKGPAPREPRSAFAAHRFTDDAGRVHDYLLADRNVRISYDSGRRRFACRQITRLDEATGHQTQVLTTRDDPDPSSIAYAMFHRWSQENFFRYMRAHYGLDALDSYATVDDDPARPAP
ncbi:MAG: putative transposase, partial [Gammaproteobacteria bacterium]